MSIKTGDRQIIDLLSMLLTGEFELKLLNEEIKLRNIALDDGHISIRHL